MTHASFRRSRAAKSLAGRIADHKLKPTGPVFFAIYDPPWIPELVRRNEIWQRLDP